VKIRRVKKHVGDVGELEHALDDATGTGSIVRSCSEQRFEKKLCERC